MDCNDLQPTFLQRKRVDMKVKTVYQCTACGYKSPKWAGKCPECGEWNTLEEGQEQKAGKGVKERKRIIRIIANNIS